ncbi:hypothetical protein BTE28158_02066 [Burkholderia territorii]|uniref:hypothetical protein n=2 Tax=Burkholderia territorii TaxID=1503055 RepID=UPI001452F54C|nr:hypothetical protein [Burkholderia territorii]VWB45743.1 hypothetical protein BTE28158_02066 [Burkholderia territorii]
MRRVAWRAPSACSMQSECRAIIAVAGGAAMTKWLLPHGSGRRQSAEHARSASGGQRRALATLFAYAALGTHAQVRQQVARGFA